MGRSRGNREGSIYYRKKDKKWVAAVTVPGGTRRVTGTAATKSDAIALLPALQRTAARGAAPASGSATLARWVASWLEYRGGTEQTADSYRRRMKPVLALIGGVRLDDLRPTHFRQVYRTMAEEYSDSTVAMTHRILRACLRDAVNDGVAEASPLDRVTQPPIARQEMRVLDVEGVKRFVASARQERLFPLFYLLVTSGLRIGEAAALRWQDVDMNRGTVQVRRTVRAVPHGHEFGPPKTPSSVRTVKLMPDVVGALRQWRGSQVIVSLDGLVFTTSAGTPVYGSVRYPLLRILERAGLPAMRIHDLRHTAATIMLAQGGQPHVVARVLGHSKPAITMNIYAHVLPSMEDDVVGRMELALTGG